MNSACCCRADFRECSLKSSFLLRFIASVAQNKTMTSAPVFFDIVPCPLGFLFVASTSRGLCAVRLGDSAEELEAKLHEEFPDFALMRDEAALRETTQTLLRHLDGQHRVLDLPLDVSGTDFQWRVWRALQTIPWGETRSYTQIAQMIEQPKAVRAVAGACAANGLALVIPCHRVVRNDGSLSGFRWDPSRKAALQRREKEIDGQETAQPLLFAELF